MKAISFVNKSRYFLLILRKVIPNFCEFVMRRRRLLKNIKNDINIYIKKENITKILYFFQKNVYIQLKALSDICVIDYPNKKNRFIVVYNLLSYRFNFRIYIKTGIPSILKDFYINSITNLYKSANWLERECWDLFGIYFVNHPNLRRILSDYGFEGFPLRKDFPLTGYIELRYDGTLESIVYEPVQLSQEFRNFNFVSPWEQIK